MLEVALLLCKQLFYFPGIRSANMLISAIYNLTEWFVLLQRLMKCLRVIKSNIFKHQALGDSSDTEADTLSHPD